MGIAGISLDTVFQRNNVNNINIFNPKVSMIDSDLTFRVNYTKFILIETN